MKFMSDNGLVFDKMEECEAFEKNPSFIMYGENGEIVNTCDEAIVVRIIEKDGAYLFEDLCVKQDSTSKGVDHFNDPGYYVWDNCSKFDYVPERIYELLKKV